jgi:hypothetical protein
MKLVMTQVFALTVLVLGFAASVEAQPYEVAYRDIQDDYIVVAHRRGVTIIEEPAPRVVIVEAPPPPPRVVVVPAEPPCVGAIWVEGHWQHTGVRFVWVGGHWITPRYGYAFVQPRWHVHAGHHYYTPGYFHPYHAKVRHQAYRRYRPRPGYVYYRGHQHPYHREHHRSDYGRGYGPPDDRHEGRNDGHHVRHERKARPGYQQRPYDAPGHQRGVAPARGPHRAQHVQRPVGRAQARPAMPREGNSRNTRSTSGRLMASTSAAAVIH